MYNGNLLLICQRHLVDRSFLQIELGEDLTIECYRKIGIVMRQELIRRLPAEHSGYAINISELEIVLQTKCGQFFMTL